MNAEVVTDLSYFYYVLSVSGRNFLHLSLSRSVSLLSLCLSLSRSLRLTVSLSLTLAHSLTPSLSLLKRQTLQMQALDTRAEAEKVSEAGVRGTKGREGGRGNSNSSERVPEATLQSPVARVRREQSASSERISGY